MPTRPQVDPIGANPAAEVYEAEIVTVDSHRVSCDGPEGAGGGPLGHPRVYLEMGAAHFVECPYCDRRFVLAGHADDADPHDEDERLDPAKYEGAAGR